MKQQNAYLESPYLFHTYRRQPLTFVRGKGAWLWDNHGRRYLDFFSGLAVCVLGHAHPGVARAVSDQARKLVHTSNIYFTEPQQRLGRELSRRTFGGKVFFSNSGTEANECAIKLARRYGHTTPSAGKPRFEIIVFENSFHGRTLGSLAATAQKKFHAGFDPLPAGFPVARFGDLSSVKKHIRRQTCAVLIEPIQGEGGVRTAPPLFFAELQKLCRRHRLLLIFDEIQTGMGRTGALFAYQNPRVVAPGVVPDVLTVAKGLANGLPIGATLARPEVADVLHPGDHASTFGGGPVPCRGALAVLEALSPKALARVRALGRFFQTEFESWKKEIPSIQQVRGQGLMWGLEWDRPGAELVKDCRENGLLINCTADRVIRLLPPFCLSDQELKRGLGILKRLLLKLTTSSKT